MNIIICGAGRVGFTIAKQLTEQNHSITIIDQSSEDIQKISDSLDVKAIVGKATMPSVLEKAPIDLSDQSSLQKGARTFINYCLNCHSAKYMRYNKLLDIGLSKKDIKANLLFKTPTIIEHGYHVDYRTRPHQTAILYLNSNNGYTRFRGGKKITSEKNKLVKFDGSLWHTGSSCTDQQHRIVINFNYIL